MRYLSLFSGIEAASCAWQPLGWALKGVCEIEKFPCNVLKHHYPDVPNIGDITKLTREKLEALGPIDLIVGGSPCQGFSTAGKQGGLNDVRSRLAIDYIRVINTVKPRWIVWENVPGVFSTNKGMDFRYFTEVLTRSGYGLCWRVLDSQYTGVAQRRRRVFLVGYLGDWRPAYEVLFESQSLPRYLKTLERTREDLARKAEARTGKTGTGTTCLNPWSEQSKRVLDINGKSDCLCASEKMRSITKISDDRGTAACMGYGKYVETEKAETLRASGGDLGGGSENICYDMAHPVDVIRTYEDGKTPTLEARMGTGGNNIPLVQDRTLYLERQYFATHEGKASTLTRDIYRDPPAVLKDEKDPLCCDVGWLQTYENKAPTQLARQYKDPPIVLNDQGGSQMTVTEDKTATLRAQEHGHQPIVVENEAYRIGSYYSNSMQSDNPNSGIYQTDKSATLQTADPTPACQQGGIAVIQGSVIGRKVENGPQGSGINIDKCFTLNTTDRHAVCSQTRVRKLTPTECLRLQGFPDDWFDGVEGYSDTAAYKAIGNSMCVNVMHWLGKRIDTVEKEIQMSDYKEVKVESLLDRLGEKIEDILTDCHQKQDYKTAHVLRMTEELREIVHEQQKTIDTLCVQVAKLTQATLAERNRRQEELDQVERDKQDEERWLNELVKEDEKLRREMEGF